MVEYPTGKVDGAEIVPDGFSRDGLQTEYESQRKYGNGNSDPQFAYRGLAALRHAGEGS